MKSESIGELAKALCKAQAEMKAAELNANNPFFKSKYADLGSVIEAIRKPFANNGLSFSQLVTSESGAIGLESMLLHESGEWISTSMSLPFGEEKGRSLAQNAGSIITYMRRYQLSALVGVYTGDDDDGNDKPKSKPAQKAPTPAPSSEMTLETACEVMTSDGELYGEMDNEKLSHVLTGIQRALDKNGLDDDRKAELMFKKDAALTIIRERNK